MHAFLDPSAWAGLFILIFLETILSIDNIIFIAILSKQLPYHQRNRARYTGLILALLMRFGLLVIASSLVNLTKPIIINKFFIFSTKEIILLIGGLFLFFKTTFELYNHIINITHQSQKKNKQSSFWYVVIQIVILDAIFSLDSIMTAIGTVQNIVITISAVTISTIIMIFISKVFIDFINSQKTTIILCLSLLLMISINLIIESLGFCFPKEYLYISIGFALFVEIMNQIRIRNIISKKSIQPFRTMILCSVKKIVKKAVEDRANSVGKTERSCLIHDSNYNYLINNISSETIQQKEINIINNALKIGDKSINDIMVHKDKIMWIDITNNYKTIEKIILNTEYNVLPVCYKNLNEIIGVVPKHKLLRIINKNKDIYNLAIQYPPIIIPNTINTINTLHFLRYSKNNIIMISDNLGSIQGMIKSSNVFNIFVGKFLNSKKMPKIIINNDNWIVQGSVSLNNLKKLLNIKIIKSNNNCYSISDFLLSKYKKIPGVGRILSVGPYSFSVLQSSLYKIHLVKIIKN
ncbi:UPF0053 inner membrane protein YoaE [Buchnera aphidicola (Cinara pseudotaxifoliae)]|uniref:UPF0053 inner membrane protein YoaE n=1 Tax=Buchnera aphidicola (Cinara pseudotaxifoliae) TaxID=655384 RepID=A0A451DH29_9GAMM|nr:transporter associated domain-containing protein [Buchnera aphidicola]VFP85934.1 UPF0053 inner membrane protein YoaE [Buchnera aphidicola (Cinara pseudotaxifoliae)]